MLLQVLKETRHLALPGVHRQGVRTFEVFSEEAQVPLIGFAGQRPQPLLHPQVGKVLAQDAGMVGDGHNLDYLLPARSTSAGRPAKEPRETAMPTFTCP
jgi:hypothetical protein